VVPDGERYAFLVFIAAASERDRREIEQLTFPAFARLVGMRAARGILSTPMRYLRK